MNDDNRNATQIVRYSLIVNGVWGRNRTVKLKVFRLADAPAAAPLADDAALALARAALPEIKLKRGAWVLDAQPMKIERRDGYQVEQWEAYTSRRIHGEQVQ